MSAEEFLSPGETSERYELVDGVVLMSPSPMPRHSAAVAELRFQIQAFARPGRKAWVLAQTDVQLSSGRVYRPDIAVYLAARMPQLLERLVTPPDLIVEVLSPSTMPLDLITKRDDYGGFGVEEYWVVDPADGSLRAWTRGAGGMMAVDVQGGAFASARLAGLTIDLAALRASCR